MKLSILGGATLVALLTPGAGAAAYEDDVHFGLTKWLALQATFDDAQAQSLAAHAVWVDHSVMRATFMVPWYACIWRDPLGSRVIQRVHFPGDGKLPGKAEDRSVAPGGYEALRLIRDELRFPAKDLGVSIGNLGDGLHPFQDSWSHQGVPGTPLKALCNPELSWGHPPARGGWNSHAADLTHRYPADALTMARATFERLCEYAAAATKKKCVKEFPGELLPDVRAFVVAQTKAQKRAWFEAQGFKDTRFLKHTSLPRGREYEASFTETLGRRSNPQALDASEEAGFMLAFYAQWLAGGNEAGLVESMIDAQQFRYPFGPRESFKPLEPALIAPMLALWRVREHGDAAAVLHGEQPLTRESLIASLNATKDINVPYQRVEEALLPLDESGAPIVLTTFEADGEKYLVAIARLRHAPYETVAVIATRRGERYRVVGIASMVDQ